LIEQPKRAVLVPLGQLLLKKVDEWVVNNTDGRMDRSGAVIQLLRMGLDTDIYDGGLTRPGVTAAQKLESQVVELQVDVSLLARLDSWIALRLPLIFTRESAIAELVAFALLFNDDGHLPPPLWSGEVE
jgi:hypothetical protein